MRFSHSLVVPWGRLWMVALLAAATVSPIAAQEKPTTQQPPKNQTFPPKFTPLPKVFRKEAPTSVLDLKKIQERVREVVNKVTPAVVGIRIGAGQGSGVIVSEDGYILTAGHVSGPSGRKVVIIMPDGTTRKGETLGANRRVDSGMIKITDKGKFPYVKMGKSKTIRKGDWCVAIGHPGGFRTGRTPVVRLGRIRTSYANVLRTDCTLVGGDSGGPLFDMNGNVIGIHSRIGPKITYNMHVPVDKYHDEWEVLIAGDKAYIGVQGDPDGKSAKIIEVYEDSPAEKAGMKKGDIVVKFAGKSVKTFTDLANAVGRQRPGRTVDVIVDRDGERVTLKLTLGRRD
ncbi:MAG: S1C family serine protease [Gemmataceae bacterium]